MSSVDAVDFVDMLEKHGFSRIEAKMFIEFNNARLATKDDLNVLSANINTRFVELENKIENTKTVLQDEIKSLKYPNLYFCSNSSNCF